MANDKPHGGVGPGHLPVDFATFVISLGSSALMALGDLPGPDGKRATPNPELAHETIDILAMLEAKTRGNLTPEEAEVLTGLLYDLRMRFVGGAGKADRGAP